MTETLVAPEPATRTRRRRRRQNERSAYLYILPAASLLIVFSLWPLIFGFWISLWRWGIKPEKFLGIGNYKAIFTTGLVTHDFLGHRIIGEIGQSLVNTLYFTVGTVAFSAVLSFFIAYGLFRIPFLQGIFRTIYFLPYVMTLVASAAVFLWIFDPQVGIANAVFNSLGLHRQTWLLDPTPVGQSLLGWIGVGHVGVPDAVMGPSVAMCVVILFNIWHTIGFSTTIYLAGLTSISTEVTEAAEMDGARGWQLIRHVILPLISPTTLFLLVYLTISSFRGFSQIYALTGGATGGGGGAVQAAGGPLGTTNVLTVDIFNNFYALPDHVGYAAAVAFLLLVCIIFLTALQFRVVGRRTFYEYQA
jgi:ABC-type sugar transport system permease subunit